MTSFAYRLFFLLHILAVLAAFAPVLVHPVLQRQARAEGGAFQRRAYGLMAGNGRLIHTPALVVSGLFGILLIVTSDDTWSFGDTWISMAFLVWFAMNGVLHAVLLPAERKVAAGDLGADQKAQLGGAIITVLLVVMLVLMIWKP